MSRQGKSIPFSNVALFSYGGFGLPLAMVALPIYVYVPQFYAEHFGMSLGIIGTALLLARLFDAFFDPACGLWIDRRWRTWGPMRFILMAAPLMVIGYLGLFHPPSSNLVQTHALTWFIVNLFLVYSGFSLASIAYQSWGAALTQAPTERTRLTAIREGCGLVGVLIAAALPAVAGIGWLSLAFLVALVITIAMLSIAPRATTEFTDASGVSVEPEKLWSRLLKPFKDTRFRWLFLVFVVNGVAAAIPATLFLFFAKDRLDLGNSAGLFLVLYFAAGAISLPVWVVVAKKRGEAVSWLWSMLLAVAAFVWVFMLPAGSVIGFGIASALSGFALGADLALPPALLAAVIGRAGHSRSREGSYFGVWNWAAKMNLALAAGIALPLLGALGYIPGTADSSGTQALGIAYALVPCGLKLLAAFILWRAPLKNF
jgi:GPH family glycoside/pentoside/hexuronide:cation symporter